MEMVESKKIKKEKKQKKKRPIKKENIDRQAAVGAALPINLQITKVIKNPQQTRHNHQILHKYINNILRKA